MLKSVALMAYLASQQPVTEPLAFAWAESTEAPGIAILICNMTGTPVGFSPSECDKCNDALVCIDARTGKTTFGPKYQPDEAARRFWAAVRAMAPREKAGH